MRPPLAHPFRLALHQAIYSYALTGSQVAAHYAAGQVPSPPPPPPLPPPPSPPVAVNSSSDAAAMAAIKAIWYDAGPADNRAFLASWANSSNPCAWLGIGCGL